MSHHVPEELLLAYVAGNSPEAVSLAVAGHLARCAECQLRSRLLEDVGGLLLDEMPGEPLSEGSLDAVLARLDEEPDPDPAPAEVPGFLAGLPLPGPLKPYLAGAKGWKTVLPGIRRVELPLAMGGVPVNLMALRGGITIPEHGHEGLELNLVLTGGFDCTLDDGEYLPGDLCVRDTDDVHTQHIHAGEDCVVLVVRGGKLVPKNLTGRIGQWLTGF